MAIFHRMFWEPAGGDAVKCAGSRRSLPDCTALGSQSTQRSVVWAAAPLTGSWPRGWGHQNRTCLRMLLNHWWYCCETYSPETTVNLILMSNFPALGSCATNLSTLRMYYHWYLLLDANEINTLLWESLEIFMLWLKIYFCFFCFVFLNQERKASLLLLLRIV